MQPRGLILQLLLFLLPSICFGAQSLDRLYTVRDIFPYVVNTPKMPVFGEHIEKRIARKLHRSQNFEFAREAYWYAREKFHSQKLNSLDRIKGESREQWIGTFQELSDRGADAIAFVEVLETSSDYKLEIVLISTHTAEVLNQATIPIEDKYSLESFSIAADQALFRIAHGIPYDANISVRRGYQVILDYGEPLLREGMRLATYTLENHQGFVTMHETGTIEITRVGNHLSFARILVENKPYEVNANNKVKVPGINKVAAGIFSKKTFGRDLASVDSTPQRPTRLGLGSLSLGFGANLVNLNNVATDGTNASARNNFYPGAVISGEVWLSRKLTFSLASQFSTATLTVSNGSVSGINSNIGSFAGQLSYNVLAPDDSQAATIKVGLGYASYRYQVDSFSDPLAFGTTSYSGITIGAAAQIPINSKIAIDFDVNALLTGSIKESPVQSGQAASSTSGWTFSLGARHELTRNLDLLGQLYFQSHRAEFVGQGTRITPLSSTSQSTRAVRLGLNYFF